MTAQNLIARSQECEGEAGQLNDSEGATLLGLALLRAGDRSARGDAGHAHQIDQWSIDGTFPRHGK